MTRAFLRRNFVRPSERTVPEVVRPEVVEEEPAEVSASEPSALTADESPPSAPPVYFGALRLITWANSARAGMTVRLGVLDRSFTDIHPFKGLGIGKENGQRFRLWIALPSEEGEDITQAEIVYKGEAILSFWSDDPTGMTVKFLLDDGPDGVTGRHPFDGYGIGPRDGQTFQGACWALNDQEGILNPAKIKPKTPFFALKEVTQAQILCRDPKFISYLRENEARILDGEVPSVDVYADGPGYAADVVRRYLGVESRGELSDQTVAADRARMRWMRLRDDYMDKRDWYR